MIIHIVWCWYMRAYGKKVNIYYVYAWRERAICDVAKKELLCIFLILIQQYLYTVQYFL